MKAVYLHNVALMLNINGEWVDASWRSDLGRQHYSYGEVPENYTETFDNPDTVFQDLINRSGFVNGYQGSKTFWKKRIYCELFPLGQGIVYKDSLRAFKIIHTYEIVDNPRIDWLEYDLGFKGYSELVFDREQELKQMLLQK